MGQKEIEVSSTISTLDYFQQHDFQIRNLFSLFFKVKLATRNRFLAYRFDKPCISHKIKIYTKIFPAIDGLSASKIADDARRVYRLFRGNSGKHLAESFLEFETLRRMQYLRFRINLPRQHEGIITFDSMQISSLFPRNEFKFCDINFFYLPLKSVPR